METNNAFDSLFKEFGISKIQIGPQDISSWLLSKIAFLLVAFIIYIVVRNIFVISLLNAAWYWPINQQLIDDGVFETIFRIIFWTVILTIPIRIFYPVRLSSSVHWALIFMYIIYLLEDNYWKDFTYLESGQVKFKYTSTLLLLPCIEILLRIKYALTALEAKSNTSQFIENVPASYNANSRTTRNNVIKILTQEIEKSNFSQAYSIGIIGDWGIGKTSFIKSLEANTKSSAIIIHFSPWLSLGKNSLLQNFSASLKEKLGAYDRTLVLNVDHYINSLIKLENSNGSILTDALDFISGHKTKSKNTEFGEINDAIRKIGKRVIVFIDDLDRLDVHEIIEVLKLIRNTANFANIIYITCYDKVYLLHALKRFNKRNLSIILDKFFDLEIPISPIPEEDLIERIEQEFFTKHNLDPAVVVKIEGYLRTHKPFTQFREINRFLTSLEINFELYGSRLYIYDFFIFEIIKVRYPFLPSLMWRKRHLFFQEEFIPSLMTLTTTKPQNNVELIDLIEYLANLESNPYQRHFLTDDDHSFISDTISLLFTKEVRHGLAIDEPHTFPKYFYYEIPDVTAFNLDMNSILVNRKYEIHEYFKEPYTAKKEADIYQILNEFLSVNSEVDKNVFIEFFIFIVDWANGKISQEILLRLYDQMSLTSRIDHFRSVITSNYTSEVQLFARTNFVNALIREILDDESKKQPTISLDVLVELNNKLFEEALKISKSFNNDTFSGLHNQLVQIEPPSRRIVLNSKSLRLFREFIDRFKVEYIDLNIRGAKQPNYDLEFVFEPFTFQIFKDKEEFETFISQSEYPERRKTIVLAYLKKSNQIQYSMYQFKLERSELEQLPVEFSNAWTSIPNNYKTETRFVSTVVNRNFSNQVPPQGNEDRNDDFHKEIFNLDIHSLRLEIEPKETEFWRLGFSFLTEPRFPNINLGRHANKDQADVHITVGDNVQNQWINKHEIKIKEYNISPMTADHRQTNYKTGDKITLSLTCTDRKSNTYTVNIVNNGSKLSEKYFDLSNYKYCVISAWCDRKPFELSSKITLVQNVKM